MTRVNLDIRRKGAEIVLHELRDLRLTKRDAPRRNQT